MLPFWESLAVMAVLKLFVAALGAFLLGRALGMRFGGSLMTGLVFGFSLWSVTWVSWPHMSVWAFLPWLCLLASGACAAPGRWRSPGWRAVTGLQFLGGHPSSSFQVLAAVGACSGSARAGRRAELRERPGAAAADAGRGARPRAALAAVALIPFAELLAHSGDARARADASDLLTQPSRYLLGMFLHDYWGRGRSGVEFGPGLEERAYYVAALPLMLAAAALVVRGTWVRLVVSAVGARRSPWPRPTAALRPGGGAARFDATNNGRFAVIAILCLAVLAGWGLDELTGDAASPPRGRPRRRGGSVRPAGGDRARRPRVRPRRARRAPRGRVGLPGARRRAPWR